MKIDLYAIDGKKVGDVEVSETFFGARVNKDLLHRSVLMRLSNLRNPIAHTMIRMESKYSTKKLYRQKGTGNARRGSRSSHLLRGGAVSHGPRNNANFTKSMPKSERRAALYSALSQKMSEGRVFAFKPFEMPKPSTKTFAALSGKIPEGRKYLFVLDGRQENIEKSVANLPGVRTILAPYLNPYDVLWADQVCFYEPALEVTYNTFTA